MAGPTEHQKTTATDVWRLVLQCSMSRVGRTSGLLQQFGLTPGHMKALLMLEPDEPRPMGSLAQRFACDASTMTWIVDRLEERGLVERGGLPGDRRVKTVSLTALGVETKGQLEARLYEPPVELLDLDENTLEVLRAALSRIASATEADAAAEGATHNQAS